MAKILLTVTALRQLPQKYLLESGADVITTGNHCFRRKEMDAFYETSDFVIRPANFPDDVVGKGYTILDHGEIFRMRHKSYGCGFHAEP